MQRRVNVHGRLTSVDEDKNAGGAQWCRRVVGWLLSFALVFTAWPQTTVLAQDAPPAASRGPEYATKPPEELQQLVAPIALYPDSLVAQILSAATFPEQAHKRRVVYDTGHDIPQTDMIEETLIWLDKYLGQVK